MPEYPNADTASQAGADPEQQPEREPMTDEEVQTEVAALVEDAETFIDTELTPQLAEATEYYQGKKFGNEVKGRSEVVVTELRDGVTAMMPSLMRAFWGPERLVEFVPNGPEDVEAAEQETDYINEVVLTQDNPGFLHTYAAFKDALVRTLGVFTWRWEDIPPLASLMEGVSEEQLQAMLAEEGFELTKLSEPYRASPLGIPATFYDIEFTYQHEHDGRAIFEPVPPEEWLFNRDARSMHEARIVGRRTRKTTSELLEMGIPYEVIEEHGGEGNKLRTNQLAIARNPAAQPVTATGGPAHNTGEPGASQYHDYYEMFPKIDVDGDRSAELRRVCLLGPGKHVVVNEPAPERPYALLVPDPEPHTIVGLSLHDYVADLQRISSFVFRAVLDSLSAHLNPRYEVVEDKVTMADVLNHQIGTPVRVKELNSVRVLEMPFEGANALPILEFVQSIKENRIGITKAAAGLNPDALQSSTKAAVAATVTAAQQRIELFARIFAETGFKDLMKGLRRLIIRHQPRARMVRLRGKYVEVDPRTWDADRDVRVNVALGLGFAEDKIKVLLGIMQEQKEMMQLWGPGNPVFGPEHYRAAFARLLKLSGYPNSDEFAHPVGYQPPPPPPAPPDPAMLVAQSQIAKDQAETQRKDAEFGHQQQVAELKRQQDAAELAQKHAEAQMRDDLERDKLDADIALRAREIELHYQGTVDTAQIKADLDRDREHIKAASSERQAQITADATVDAAAAKPAPKAAA